MKNFDLFKQQILLKGTLDHDDKSQLQYFTCPSLLETLSKDYKKLATPDKRKIQNIELINIFRLTRAYRNALIVREDPFETLGKDFAKKFNKRVDKVGSISANQVFKLKLDTAIDRLLTLPEKEAVGIKGKIPTGLFPFLSSKQDVSDEWFRSHVDHVQNLVSLILDYQELDKKSLMTFVYNNSTVHLLKSQPQIFQPKNGVSDAQYLYQCSKTFLELGRGLMTNKVKIY